MVTRSRRWPRLIAAAVRSLALWCWFVALAACGGAPGTRDASPSGARTDDSLAARAMAANAREQGGATETTASAPAPAQGSTAAQAGGAARPRPARAFGPSIGFRSRQRLDEHYAKHGAEFGAIDTREYLRQAQQLRDAPVGGDVLEIRRGDGTVSRFDRGNGAFIAFDDDGAIRTYFKPNDGERYFRRQARRRSGG